MTELNVVILNNGPDVAGTILFVHGSEPSWGTETSAKQEDLADRYRLLFADRRGFSDSPSTDRVDFEADAFAMGLSKSLELNGPSSKKLTTTLNF